MGLTAHLKKSVCYKMLHRVLVLDRVLGLMQAARNGHEIWGLKEVEWEGMEWIHLVHNRNQWQALLNMVINLWVP
jgi:hypothetical protein